MSYMVKSKPGHLNPICMFTRSKIPWKLTNDFSAIRSNFGSILSIFELNDFIYNNFGFMQILLSNDYKCNQFKRNILLC